MSRSTPRALRRTLGLIVPHLRGYRLLALGGLAALLADVVLRILEPWPLKWVIDSLTASLGADLSAVTGIPPATGMALVACALALALIIAARAGANYLSTVAFAFVGSRATTALRARVFAHVQALPLRYHVRTSPGDTVQRLVGDIGRLQEVAVTAGLPLVGNVLTLVVLSGVMTWLDPLLAVIALAAACAYLYSSRRTAPAITRAARRTRAGEGSLAGTAAETLSAIRVVQAYRLEGVAAETFASGNEVALRDGIKSRRLAARLERGTDVIVGVATALVLVVGGLRVLQGRMTPGDLVLFVMYLKIAMRPLRDMAKFTGRIARAAASGERVADLLDEPVEICDRPGAQPLPRIRGDVHFRDMTAYDGHGRVLFDRFTLRIPAGQRVCLLGPSGAGKSTLASFVPRLADPHSGAVRVDGHDVGAVSLDSLRSQITILLQESVLFATTVRGNIRYGRLDATDEEVEEAAVRAGAHAFIAELPEGYDTVLGSRGDTLSGGQRQRVAIARALLRDAPIVILDEAANGLDPRTRADVLRSISTLIRGRTTITITHDATEVLGSDRVLWLEAGAIVEDGDPRTLLADPRSRLSRWLRAQVTS